MKWWNSLLKEANSKDKLQASLEMFKICLDIALRNLS